MFEIYLENFRIFLKFGYKYENSEIFQIIGGNGAGKTSLLEAIFFAIYGNSFRERELTHLININKNYLFVQVRIGKHTISGYLDREERKRVKLDGEIVKRREVLEKFLCLYITGKDNLFDLPQYDRKRVLDKLIALKIRDYRKLINEYRRVFVQKKRILEEGGDLRILRILNQQLFEYYQKIVEIRKMQIKEIRDFLENWDVKYHTSISEMKELDRREKEEFEAGEPLIGLHADRIEILKDGMDIRSFLSHGWKQRLWIGYIVEYISGLVRDKGQGVLLLDEVFSVFDRNLAFSVLGELDRKNLWIFFTGFEPFEEGKIPVIRL